jgi:hypothetical protein
LKTVIKLLIVALVLNACVRGAIASWEHYRLRDAIEQEAKYSSLKTVPALRQHLAEVAAAHDVWLEPNDIQIEQDGSRITVTMAYYDYIELVPRLYTREHLFEFSIAVMPARPLTPR